MARLSPVPAPLDAAVSRSAAKYGVPRPLLLGIWREEAGSAYPNVAVNSSGYGGLFGTTDWNGPVQEQSDLAASILATGLKKSGGDDRAALSYYNTGKTDSPQGLSYAETVLGLSGAGSKVAAGIVSTRSRPQVTGGGGGFWGPIEGAAGGAVGAVEGAGGSLIKGAEDLINGPVDFFKAMVWLINPLTWLRAVEGLFGFVLILAGVAIVLGADRAIAKAPGPTAGAAALAAEA